MRVLLLIVIASICGLPILVSAQPNDRPIIGILVGAAKENDRAVEALRIGLSELGYVHGNNIRIEFRTAQGHYDRFSALASELVALKPDVIIVTNNGAAQALKRATSTLPIVLLNIFDPVSENLVTNLSHPGGNITGLTSLAEELIGKRLQLLKEATPNLSTVAVLRNPPTPPARATLKTTEHLEAAARSMSITLKSIVVTKPEELRTALKTLAKVNPQGVFVTDGALFYLERRALVNNMAEARLPAIYATRAFAEEGGLMSYGVDYADQARRAAVYVDKILRGAKPGELPIEQPTKFELVINLKTAKALGITIPESILLRADEIIR